MTLRNLLIALVALLVLLVAAIGLTSINHPIILKWVTGSAKHHGKPMPATVYTNGEVNHHAKVFYTDEENNYLLSLTDDDGSDTLKFINIDLNEKSIGRPVATSKNDYDFIAGHLFQSETAVQYSPFQDTKGFNFDSQLSFVNNQIKFNMPPNKAMIDSVRIILP